MSDHNTLEKLNTDVSKMTIVVEDDVDNNVQKASLSPISNNGVVISGNNDEVSIPNGNQSQSPEKPKKVQVQQQQPLGQRYVLEDFKKCSESHLWKLMMSFYDRKGPESWSQGIVPHFITCNTFIGRCYAKVLHGFIRDCYRSNTNSHMKFNETEPLYIIELGAGSGKFSFFMLKALAEMKDNCDFPYSKIVYIMTDFTQNNFDFWSNHPSLKPYFDSGHLDAAIFDAVSDTEIKCWKSGNVLNMTSTSTTSSSSSSSSSSNICQNPVIIVANYLFDTLYHDIFQVSAADGGEIKEGLVSVGSKQNEVADPLNPDIINRLDNLYQYRSIDPYHFYTDEEGDEIHLGRILNWYKEYYKNNSEGASLLFPIGALRALRRLRNLSSQGRILVISGDKGNNNPEQFLGLSDPHIAVHGSFSLMVNYHAIGAWFTSQGGFSLHNPQEEASLKVSCFVLEGDGKSSNAINKNNSSNVDTDEVLSKPEKVDYTTDKPTNVHNNNNSANATGTSSTTTTFTTTTSDWQDGVDFINDMDTHRSATYPSLRHAFDDCMTLFGPNDFFVLQKSLKEDMTTAPLRTVIALLKLSDWDPDIFFKFRDSILNNAPSCSLKLCNDLCRGIPRVWENHYMLDAEKDVAFEIGRFYYGIKDYNKALSYYSISHETIGPHHVTSHNKGLCYYSLNERELALTHFQEAHKLDANYEKAKNWIEKVTKEKTEKESRDNNNSSNVHSSSDAINNVNDIDTSDEGTAAVIVSPITAENIMIDSSLRLTAINDSSHANGNGSNSDINVVADNIINNVTDVISSNDSSTSHDNNGNDNVEIQNGTHIDSYHTVAVAE